MSTSILSDGYYISWSEVDKIHRSLAKHLIVSCPSPIDTIVAIARGGLPTAAHIAYLCNIPNVLSIQVSKNYSELGVAPPAALVSNDLFGPDTEKLINGCNVLIIDGAIGSGESLSLVYGVISNAAPASITSAVVAGWSGCHNYKNKLRKEITNVFIGQEYISWPIFPWEG